MIVENTRRGNKKVKIIDRIIRIPRFVSYNHELYFNAAPNACQRISIFDKSLYRFHTFLKNLARSLES